MRNSQAVKDANRRRILEVAAPLFRERGVQGVSVADVMQAAGMTHGGFYRHFVDKDELVAEALATSSQQRADERKSAEQSDLATYAAAYLSAEHRERRREGCMFAALGSELVRGPDGGRQAMTEAMREQIKTLSETAAGRNAKERRRSALASWSTMVGALTLSRLSDDPELSDEILDAALNLIVTRLSQKTSPDG
ncbi:TetR/AcrR family transcriptional regulator [Bordetella muralis]|jgi:TetR/AcrR family transcriptional regulator, transcriptional repressor for nem operon|uniref:TetR/AcrR family transcriptional regulator n=1 Tax=Bordetella muralis TaxID=1649130 RepID=UPI0039F136B3